MTISSEVTDREASQAWFRLWDMYFVLGYLALIGIMLNADEVAPIARTVVIAAMSLMAFWYLAYGRRVILAEQELVRPWPGRVFAAGVVLLLGVAVVSAQLASIGLFAVCPLIFMSVRLREAIGFIVAANLLPAVNVTIYDGIEHVLTDVGPGILLSLTLSVLLGTWIYRVVTESEERKKLIDELERSREEIGRLSREAGVVAERSRLAAEIHDTLAQGFTSVLTLVQAAESELDGDQAGDREKVRHHLRLAARTARENLGEARALVAGLMPSVLGTASLDEAIHRQLERLAEETAMHTDYEVEGDIAELPTGLEVVLLRTVQESLTNVRRHADAARVTIHLRADATTATLRVTDDGTGFDPELAVDGYGLRGMRARAEQVGGSLEIGSGPAGTTLTLEVPT
ncbi:sensor histidine kinase [Actinophytocola sediminis]